MLDTRPHIEHLLIIYGLGSTCCQWYGHLGTLASPSVLLILFGCVSSLYEYFFLSEISFWIFDHNFFPFRAIDPALVSKERAC